MPSQMLLGADVRNCLLKCWKCVKSIDSLLERFCRGNVSFHRITNNVLYYMMTTFVTVQII